MMAGLMLDRSGCSPLMSHFHVPSYACNVWFPFSLRLVTFLARITHFFHLAGYGRCSIMLCNFFSKDKLCFAICWLSDPVCRVTPPLPLHSHTFAFVILGTASASSTQLPLLSHHLKTPHSRYHYFTKHELKRLVESRDSSRYNPRNPILRG